MSDCEQIAQVAHFYAEFWTEIEPVLKKKEDEDLFQDCDFYLNFYERFYREIVFQGSKSRFVFQSEKAFLKEEIVL